MRNKELKKSKKRLDLHGNSVVALAVMRKGKKMNKQLNLWPGGLKKQKFNRGNPLTKKDKLFRIKTYKEIRNSGGTFKDIALKWGISPNSSGTVYWKVLDYYNEGVILKKEWEKIKHF